MRTLASKEAQGRRIPSASFGWKSLAVVALFLCSVAGFAQNAGPGLAWGDNEDGQLGMWPVQWRSLEPVPVKGLTGTVAVAAGNLSSVALKQDGTVWAWGANYRCQLGDGTIPIRSNVPLEIHGLSGVVAISGSWEHALVLRNDGTVWGWGFGGFGQLGNGGESNSCVPVQAQGLADVVAIATGFYHSLALERNGTVWAWGDNSAGQLGNFSPGRSNVPIQVSGVSEVVAIASAGMFCLALRSDGSLWAWGSNDHGQLGDGTTETRVLPVCLQGIDHLKAIACGWEYALAVRDDGSLWAWGANGDGQLGIGTYVDSLLPNEVQGLQGIVAAAGGSGHSLALEGDGTLWVWGRNYSGQLGTGNTEGSSVPVKSPTLSGVRAISSGQMHSLALGPPAPPVVSSLTKLGNPFRIVVEGSNLQDGIRVFINESTTEWAPIGHPSRTMIKLKGGNALKAAVPKGDSTNFRFVNPDGGETTVTGWNW